MKIFPPIQRSLIVANLTRRHWRASQVTPATHYHFNGHSQSIKGDSIISLLANVIMEDCYGLRRFRDLSSIVDVGANIGIFAMHATTLFPKAQVQAYEPFSENIGNLRANLAGFSEVSVFAEAVGSSSRQVQIEDHRDRSACYVTEAGGTESNYTNAQMCNMIGLSTAVERARGSIDLLKLDCEGSEYEIMQTAALEQVAFIAGELHTCEAGNPEEGFKILKEQGFQIDRWNPFPDGLAGDFWASNTRNKSEQMALLKSHL